MTTHHKYHGHHRHHHHRRSTRRLQTIHYVMIALVVVLLLVGLYYGGRWLEMKVYGYEEDGSGPDDTTAVHHDARGYSTVEYGGETYKRRSGITTILLMGVDSNDSTVHSSGTRSGGQSDFLRLVVIDSRRKTISQVQIDRDTMTPITILGVLGNRSSVRTAQICLSHSYGDGKDQSCRLTVEAVENLLFNKVDVDFYIAMNMDGISELNDAVGGVTVTLADDFSAMDPAMTQGATVTLQGDQAEIYVRSRRSMAVGTNEARMTRQQQYISLFTDKLDARIQKSKSFIGELFDTVNPYLVTNMARGRLINEVWAAKDYERTFITLEGTKDVGESGYMEFHIDDRALEDHVMELFYEKVS